jgi:hypothetical protein
VSAFQFTTIFIGVALFVGILAAFEFGRWHGQRRAAAVVGIVGTKGSIDAALFGLLGLLIAFTFSGAVGRFDSRRQLIVDEANYIGTAYSRINLVTPDAQPELRAKFRDYLDARLAVYENVDDESAVMTELDRSQKLQREIWELATAASKRTDWVPAATLLLPAINAMIDITTTRTMMTRMHPPIIVFVMLIILVLASAMIAGYGTAQTPTRNWMHIFVFALIFSITVFVIIDLEYPRLGFLKIDSFDQALIDLRKIMQ